MAVHPAPAAAAEPSVEPRAPGLDRATSSRLAATELEQFVLQLDRLRPADGARPTECPGWDVRAVASHVLGMTEMFSAYRHNGRQHLQATRAARAGVPYLDALTARQVADRMSMSLEQVRVALIAVAPRNVRWRYRAPGLLRRRAMPDLQAAGGGPDAPLEAWTFAYLFDTILTRDTWMHRGDIARACGIEQALTAEHDGRLVADVVAEWSGRHREPYSLRLTGPAGGSWSRGAGGPEIELDAVEFCRQLSGRSKPSGLLKVSVPF